MQLVLGLKKQGNNNKEKMCVLNFFCGFKKILVLI